MPLTSFPSEMITTEDVRALLAMPMLGEEDVAAFCNPAPDLQLQFNFSELPNAYQEAADFLNFMLGQLEHAPGWTLDFGCAWGRLLRLLRRIKALEGTEMHGCDLYPHGMDFVRRTVPGVYLSRTQVFPPSMYRNECFDLIYAYSVFSHLSEESHLAWAREYRRLIRPGGTVCVSAQGEKFIRWCEASPEHFIHKPVPVFLDHGTLERFRAGEFLYVSHDSSMPHYGHAAVPRSYFEEAWGRAGFKVVAWDESGSQNRCVMRVR